MGEYNLNDCNGTIVIDGHRFSKVREDSYKVLDPYYINIKKWQEDKSNEGLYILVCLNSPEDGNGYVEYVSIGYTKELGEIMDEVYKEYTSTLELTCANYGCSPFEGGICNLTVFVEDEKI